MTLDFIFFEIWSHYYNVLKFNDIIYEKIYFSKNKRILNNKK